MRSQEEEREQESGQRLVNDAITSSGVDFSERFFRGLTLVLMQGSQELHGAQWPQTQSTAGGSGSVAPLK